MYAGTSRCATYKSLALIHWEVAEGARDRAMGSRTIEVAPNIFATFARPVERIGRSGNDLPDHF